MKHLNAIALTGIAFARSATSAARHAPGPVVTGTYDLPVVGINNIQSVCADNAEAIGGGTQWPCDVKQRLTKAFEMDGLLKVTSFERGDLHCDTLESAVDAPELHFKVSTTEVVHAKAKSRGLWSGSPFSDNRPRQVWTGDVIEASGFQGIPRSIAMAWTGCDAEAFVMKMITPMHDGRIKSAVSIPCDVTGEPNELCILQVIRESEDERDVLWTYGGEGEDVDGESEPGALSVPSTRRSRRYLRRATSADEPMEKDAIEEKNRRPLSSRGRRKLEARRRLAREVEEGVAAAHENDPDLQNKDADLRLLNEYLFASPDDKEAFHSQGIRRLSSDKISMPSGRILTSSSTIDVMVLYTTKAMIETDDENGPMRNEAKMETDITAAYEEANNALKDSDVGITLNVVFIGRTPYEEGEESADAVVDLYTGGGQASTVPGLRDKYGADLVQMIAFYSDTCGIGYTMQKPTSAFAQFGYSIVHTNCLSNFSHIHEVGHNMGANHDKENAVSDHPYAYGYRYCDGGDKSYRTIMAYEGDCTSAPRVNIFSNPDKIFLGIPQGTATANNARVLREAATVVANFRESTASLTTTSAAVSMDNARPMTPIAALPAEEARKASNATTTTLPKPKKNSGTPRSISGERQSDQSGVSPPTEVSIYPEEISGKVMERKGCYKDSPLDRVMVEGAEMPAVEGVTIGMRRENCLAYCHKKKAGYQLFGVEFGNECFCGKKSTDGEGLESIPEMFCQTPCSGDATQTCGGYLAIEVFEIGDLDKGNTAEHWSYEGCFRDNTPTDAEMANLPVADYTHATPEACNMHCREAGYSFFALEFGFLCRCGSQLPDFSREVADDLCDMPCSGTGRRRMCGGNWHIAVFAVDAPATKQQQGEGAGRGDHGGNGEAIASGSESARRGGDKKSRTGGKGDHDGEKKSDTAAAGEDGPEEEVGVSERGVARVGEAVEDEGAGKIPLAHDDVDDDVAKLVVEKERPPSAADRAENP